MASGKKYGYLGSVPSQSRGINTGFFNLDEIFELRGDNTYGGLPDLEVQYVLIAGGGGGSNWGVRGAGGGGAGGYRSSVVGENSGGGAAAQSVFVPTLGTAYSVTIGGGGTGQQTGTNGSASTFDAISATGGGGGGWVGGSYPNGQTGGSGGGGGHGSGGANGASGQGYKGGSGLDANPFFSGGGGGGAGSLGGNAINGSDSSTRITGAGGTGVVSSITGTAVERAGGGRGQGVNTGHTNGSTSGGGGGTANTGGGGNGGVTNGGSGILILRYPRQYTVATSGLTVGAAETQVGTATSSSGSLPDHVLVIHGGIGGTVTWSLA